MRAGQAPTATARRARPAAPPGLAACDSSCVDTQVSPFHCGACGVAAGPHQRCDRGELVCDEGFADCDPVAPGCESDLTRIRGTAARAAPPASRAPCASPARARAGRSRRTTAARPAAPAARTRTARTATAAPPTCEDGGARCKSTGCADGEQCCSLVACRECCTSADCSGGEICSGGACHPALRRRPRGLRWHVRQPGLGRSLRRVRERLPERARVPRRRVHARVGLDDEARAPAPRQMAAATWIGERALPVRRPHVGRGRGRRGALRSGARHVVDAGQRGRPSPRVLAAAAWTGSRVLVWGGGSFTSLFGLSTGGVYDPRRGPGAR